MFDFAEFIKRIVKYLVMGLMISLAAYAIPKKSMNMEEVLLIATTGAATFCILDTYLPQIGLAARNGVGAGIGFNLVGFPGGL